MNIIEIVFSIYGMIAIALVLIALKKIDTDNKRMLKEVRHGEWEKNYNGTYTCSHCSNCSCRKTKFCPNCGADMRETTERREIQ